MRIVEEMLDRLNVAHPNYGLDRSLRIDRVVCFHVEADPVSDRSRRNIATACYAACSNRMPLARRRYNGGLYRNMLTLNKLIKTEGLIRLEIISLWERTCLKVL